MNRLTGWRKIANALWDAPNDPQIYGTFELDATQALAFVARARSVGRHLTTTHLVGRAVARALVAVPELNVRLVGDYAVPRGGVDVFFITSVAKGRDLTGVKVEDADQKSAWEVGKELEERSQRMKRGDDPDLARAKGNMDRLPRPLLRAVLRAGAWIAGDHARALPSLGIPASPFGSAMVSNVGGFALPAGFSPLCWLYRVPLLVVTGAIEQKPVASSGRVEIRPILPVSATVDHRYVDGAQIAEAFTAFRDYLADPAAFEPMLDGQNIVRAARPLDRDGELRDATVQLAHDAAKELDALRHLRDELRVQVHLASAEAKTQWGRLEERWHALESNGPSKLLEELREGYHRLRTTIKS